MKVVVRKNDLSYWMWDWCSLFSRPNVLELLDRLRSWKHQSTTFFTTFRNISRAILISSSNGVEHSFHEATHYAIGLLILFILASTDECSPLALTQSVLTEHAVQLAAISHSQRESFADKLPVCIVHTFAHGALDVSACACMFRSVERTALCTIVVHKIIRRKRIENWYIGGALHMCARARSRAKQLSVLCIALYIRVCCCRPTSVTEFTYSHSSHLFVHFFGWPLFLLLLSCDFPYSVCFGGIFCFGAGFLVWVSPQKYCYILT